MPAYPQQIPLDEVRTVINMIRNDQVRTNFSVFLLNAWWVQGYAQSMIPLSAPNTVVAQGAFDGLETLEKIASDVPSPQMSIPWELLLQWLIEEILRQFKTSVLS